MNAHRLAATLIDDRTLVLNGLPFQTGDTVEIIILEQPKEERPRQTPQEHHPLQGTALRYSRPK